MNTRAILAITRKDLKVVSRSRGVMIPLIIVPIIFLVVLPAGAALMAQAMTNSSLPNAQSTQSLLKSMPPQLMTELSGYTDVQKVVVLMINYMMAPLFLILPLMVASVIAADSFAGEKERKTLEGLLYTPTTDAELFIGKQLSAWIPAVAIAVGGFIIYGIVANVAGWPIMGKMFFPNWTWIILIFWVSPAAAALSLGVMILVSLRVQTFQEAYQIGGMVVLPVVLLTIGQATGVIYISTGLVFILGLILWALDLGLLWFCLKVFRRSEIIGRI